MRDRKKLLDIRFQEEETDKIMMKKINDVKVKVFDLDNLRRLREYENLRRMR